MNIDWEWMIETLGMMKCSLRVNFINKPHRELSREHKAAIADLRAALNYMGEAERHMRSACGRVDDERAKASREWHDERGDKEPVF